MLETELGAAEDRTVTKTVTIDISRSKRKAVGVPQPIEFKHAGGESRTLTRLVALGILSLKTTILLSP